jgi:spore coat protein U-like protein
MRRLTLVLASLPLAALQLATGITGVAACQVDTKAVAFGVVDVTRGTESRGEIAVSCPITTDVEVGLASGSEPGQRAMLAPGGGRLTYELFTDATRQRAWGDGSGNGATVSASDVGEDVVRLPIYGEVPQQDPVPPGAYTDSLTVVVTFF